MRTICSAQRYSPPRCSINRSRFQFGQLGTVESGSAPSTALPSSLACVTISEQ
ncbi:hypothetical protein J2S53_003984 [Actinopolyspora lacussalsi]|nr:hypothetical protein [Actinopolyspora lacussalsi]